MPQTPKVYAVCPRLNDLGDNRKFKRISRALIQSKDKLMISFFPLLLVLFIFPGSRHFGTQTSYTHLIPHTVHHIIVSLPLLFHASSNLIISNLYHISNILPSIFLVTQHSDPCITACLIMVLYLQIKIKTVL